MVHISENVEMAALQFLSEYVEQQWKVLGEGIKVTRLLSVSRYLY